MTIRAVGPAVVAALFTVASLLWTVSIARRSLAFAFWINWALMGAAFVVWTLVPIRLWRGYYRVRAFERSGGVYAVVGVRGFQRLLRASRFHGPVPFPRYQRGPTARETLIADTYGSETAHLIIFAVLTGLAANLAWRGWWDTAAWLSAFNVLFNAYPVMSMRHIRARVDRCTRSSKVRAPSTAECPASATAHT